MLYIADGSFHFCFRQGSREPSGNQKPNLQRALSYNRKGDFDGALTAYNASLRLIPRRSDVPTNIMSFMPGRQYEKAIENYRLAP